MQSNRRHPEQQAVWEIDHETGEVEDLKSVTDWPDE
jgi:hypothetical protein